MKRKLEHYVAKTAEEIGLKDGQMVKLMPPAFIPTLLNFDLPLDTENLFQARIVNEVLFQLHTPDGTPFGSVCSNDMLIIRTTVPMPSC